MPRSRAAKPMPYVYSGTSGSKGHSWTVVGREEDHGGALGRGSEELQALPLKTRRKHAFTFFS